MNPECFSQVFLFKFFPQLLLEHDGQEGTNREEDEEEDRVHGEGLAGGGQLLQRRPGLDGHERRWRHTWVTEEKKN